MTPHFGLDEFTYSATALDRHIDNSLPAELQAEALRTLQMMERIRERLGQLINEYPDRNGWVHTSTAQPMRSVNRIITITTAGVSAGITEA